MFTVAELKEALEGFEDHQEVVYQGDEGDWWPIESISNESTNTSNPKAQVVVLIK